MDKSLLKTNLKIILSSLIVAVILFWAVFSGITNGKELAQAQIVYQTAQNLKAGLEYFYSDQNRFPSSLEFTDPKVMLNYFTVFPPIEFSSVICSQSFVYKRDSANNFNLSFCLPVGFNKTSQGWSNITEQK